MQNTKWFKVSKHFSHFSANYLQPNSYISTLEMLVASLCTCFLRLSSKKQFFKNAPKVKDVFYRSALCVEHDADVFEVKCQFVKDTHNSPLIFHQIFVSQCKSLLPSPATQLQRHNRWLPLEWRWTRFRVSVIRESIRKLKLQSQTS